VGGGGWGGVGPCVAGTRSIKTIKFINGNASASLQIESHLVTAILKIFNFF